MMSTQKKPDHSTTDEGDEGHEILAGLKATVDYHREMGLEELLIVAGETLVTEDESIVSDQSNQEALDELKGHLEGCTRCPLHERRATIVFGEGSPEAPLVFVGEGPGAEEDRQGKPFVGAAGKLLTRIIEAIGLTRLEVYICNVVKCRPPGNRTPTADEQATCGPFVDRQLEIISPKVIVALGKTAANDLLGLEEMPMGRLRGRFHPRGDAVVMPTYHPAYLLRNPAAKRAVWDDMKKVRDRLDLPK